MQANPALAGTRDASRGQWRTDGTTEGVRRLAVEVPVAIVVNASTFAVMLASPLDLEDFAVGFALSERIVEAATGIEGVEIVEQPDGVEVRLWIAALPAAALAERRRHIAGPSGCGLCGVDSLAAAVRLPVALAAAGPWPRPAEIVAALAQLDDAQPIGAATRAVHAASLWRRGQPLLVREDVGRHNALDKLLGAVRRNGVETRDAMLLLTSRVSVEMVQKAAVLGAPVIVAVSAPTSLAVEHAVVAGLTLVAVARPDGFEVFAGAERIDWD